jgi:hypothetical protein
MAAGSGVALAAAIAVKPVILPIAVVLAWSYRRQWRVVAVAAAAAVLTLLLLYVPFLLTVEGVEGHVRTLVTFMRDWRFNGSVHALLERVLGSKPAADWMVVAMLASWIVIVLRYVHDRWKASLLVLGAALLLTSTLYPWYLLWALPLLAIRFQAWLWLWSLTVMWSYAVLAQPEAWRLPWAVVVAQYAPVYVVALAALAEAAAVRFTRREPA